jgi:secreted Zn-dependent insulinase-like peptidase
VYYASEKLKEYIPAHLQEEFSWSVSPSDDGINITLKMPGDNVEESLLAFFSCFTTMPLDDKLFEKVKQDFIDSYNGDPAPVELAEITAKTIIISHLVPVADIYAYFPSIELEEFKEYLSTVFTSNICVNGSFYGNLSEQEARNYWNRVKSCFHSNAFKVDYNDPDDRSTK